MKRFAFLTGDMTALLPMDGAPLPFDTATLDADTASICALDRALRITYVNPAWAEFSRVNGGDWGSTRWRVGCSILDAIPEALRPFFEGLFARAQTSRTAVDHSYECSSATTFRRFRMRVFPCQDSALVISHSLARAVPQTHASHAPSEALYRGAYGFIIQCSHCRRVQRITQDALHWDWVPEYVVHLPASTSHGLCQLCGEYFYGIETQSERDVSASSPAGPAAILLVEGEDFVRTRMARILRRAGHAVTDVASGEEALRAAERGPFDLLLVDPTRCDGGGKCTGTSDGTRTARAIRALDPGVSVVLVSEKAPVEEPLATWDFVKKPFDARTLLAGVQAALGTRG